MALTDVTLVFIGRSVTVLAKDAWNQMMRENELARPYAQASLEMVDLDPSLAANERRCQLVDRALERQPYSRYMHERPEPALPTALLRSGGPTLL